MTAIDFEHLDLDTIRAEAGAKYKNLIVQGVTFRGVLRLTKAERLEFRNILKKLDEAEDVVDIYKELLTLVASDKDAVKSLLDQIEDDGAVLDTLVSLYFERTQVGEA